MAAGKSIVNLPLVGAFLILELTVAKTLVPETWPEMKICLMIPRWQADQQVQG